MSQSSFPKNQSLPALLARAAETYKRALIGHQPGLTWDYVVLTAANEHQAAGYRHELALRSSGAGPLGAFFPLSQQSIVVPDPPGFRAGSGGATFGVLRAIGHHQKSIGDKKPFDALRILLIHSGGASQRLPQYSPLGKIFAPLPLIRPDGQLMTLFDHLYLMMAGLPPRLGSGMLVAAGDVFLLFDAMAMSTPPRGITALSIRTDAAMGEHHGVFKTQNWKHKTQNKKPGWETFSRVCATMQKATVAEMRGAGVIDSQDRVLIDSGLVFFDSSSTTALYHLAKKYRPSWHIKTRQQIDLYADIVPAALKTEPAQRRMGGPVKKNLCDSPVARFSDSVSQRLRADLQSALANFPLHVYELQEAHFQHLGTTRQFRDAMTGLDRSPACSLFQQNVRFASDSALPKSARIFQSVISTKKARIGANTIIENCILPGAIEIGHGSILSNLALSNRSMPTSVIPIIPPNTLIFSVTIIDGRANRKLITVIMGINDDFKNVRVFCNFNFHDWLKKADLTEADLWPKASTIPRTLWTAKLYRAVNDTESHLTDLDWMMNPASLSVAARKDWLAGPRYSMADILELADASALAAHRDTLSGMLQATEWIKAVTDQTAASVQNTINHFGSTGYQRLTDQIFTAAQNRLTPPLLRARLNWSLGEIESRPHFPKENIKLSATAATLQKKSFDQIREALSQTTRSLNIPLSSFIVHPSSLITAAAPVRLDLAGGWTDTPPYCLENGGAVVNIAINLNDVEPIQSTFRLLDEPIVRLVSRDLGKTLIISDPAKLRENPEPGDPFALHVAALRLTGVAPAPHEISQKKWLARLFCCTNKSNGFELATASNLPKGSGMGTSSILGASTLAVLRRAVGLDTRASSLFEQTLLLEQNLGTGGGWQDQVGGIVGGAKITLTKPGIPQLLRVRKIALSFTQIKAMEERLVVYFTGQQRLARNILREVMGRYLSREPGTMVLFNELRHSAHACEIALRKSDWLSLGMEINRYWRTKKELFPGSTTPAVDALFLELRPFYLGGGLAGAGGGGFAYFLCADASQAHRLRTELARISTRPGSLGLTFTAEINGRGLRVF